MPWAMQRIKYKIRILNSIAILLCGEKQYSWAISE